MLFMGSLSQDTDELFKRPSLMPWRAERTKGHGSDCVCEWCFLAPPLPTAAENMDALSAMAATLVRIEKLLTPKGRQAPPSQQPPPSPPKASPPKPDSPDFL